MKTRSVSALLVAIGVLVGADVALRMASPAQAQPSETTKQHVWVSGITNNGTLLYRTWSDGVVEARDTGASPLWVGWRALTP